jgi:hypothetical protein
MSTAGSSVQDKLPFTEYKWHAHAFAIHRRPRLLAAPPPLRLSLRTASLYLLVVMTQRPGQQFISGDTSQINSPIASWFQRSIRKILSLAGLWRWARRSESDPLAARKSDPAGGLRGGDHPTCVVAELARLALGNPVRRRVVFECSNLVFG